MTPKRSAGFSLLEIMVVMAIIGVLAAAAVPGMRAFFLDQRLKSAARSVADSLYLARTEAIRTGHNQLVFFQQDTDGNTLTDAAGNPVPILRLDDGRPGSANQNCKIDAGEPTVAVNAERDVTWGALTTTVRAPNDPVGGAIDNFASFRGPDGVEVGWVMFRPDGIPVGVSAGCVAGTTGSGGGAVYLSNGRRDYAIVLSPLGALRVHAIGDGANWRQ